MKHLFGLEHPEEVVVLHLVGIVEAVSQTLKEVYEGT
jgi:hypothetical protein